MKAKDLAELIYKYPDFDVRFSFLQGEDIIDNIHLRTFKDVEVIDLGHSDKVIVLGGSEC